MSIDIKTAFRAALVGAILIALPMAAGALVPKTPLISLGQAGATARMSDENSPDAKMMMPNPFSYNYVAGPGLSDQNGTGHVFELQLTGQPQEVLSSVARALGVPGEVYVPEYSTKEYPALAIGAQDGNGESVNIYFSGTGNWWYNNPAAWNSKTMPVCDEPTAEAETSCTGPLPTPELLPTRVEIIKFAMNIFSATGLAVTEKAINVSINEWGASAFASMQIAGQDSPIEWSVSWGPTGKVASASGHSVKPVDRGEYETISAKEAVARMSDWRYSGQAAQSVWQKYQPADDGRAIVYDDVTAEPELQPEPSPSVVNISIKKSETVQLMIWDKKGNAWVVPGYVLVGDQGWISPIFSLKDGVVELPEPMEISPMVK